MFRHPNCRHTYSKPDSLRYSLAFNHNSYSYPPILLVPYYLSNLPTYRATARVREPSPDRAAPAYTMAVAAIRTPYRPHLPYLPPPAHRHLPTAAVRSGGCATTAARRLSRHRQGRRARAEKPARRRAVVSYSYTQSWRHSRCGTGRLPSRPSHSSSRGCYSYRCCHRRGRCAYA